MKLIEAIYRGSLLALGGSQEWRSPYEWLLREHQGRPYHNWEHVLSALGVASMLSLQDGLDEFGWARVAFALFNHDRVYDPLRDDNEARSAELAYLDAPDDEACRLILLTKGHDAHDLLGRIVVDADMAILDSPPSTYALYSEAIRAEYDHLPEEEYRMGRSAFLSSQLQKPKLFHHLSFDEERARRNMREELKRLS